ISHSGIKYVRLWLECSRPVKRAGHKIVTANQRCTATKIKLYVADSNVAPHGDIMRHTAQILALVAVALASPAVAANVSTDPKSAPAGAYEIETHHTQVVFAIPHLGITD